MFVAFDLENDHWRLCQMRWLPGLSLQPLTTFDGWDAIKAQGDDFVADLIVEQLQRRDALTVLLGKHTSTSRWVSFAIDQAIGRDMPIIGVYAERLRDMAGGQDARGPLPPALASAPPRRVTIFGPGETDPNACFERLRDGLPVLIRDAIDRRPLYIAARNGDRSGPQ